MAWRGEQTAALPTGRVRRAGNQAQGYYAGGFQQYPGTGSGQGAPMAGVGTLAAGQGVSIGGQDWHPTVLYLGALIVVEMVVFGYIAHLLK